MTPKGPEELRDEADLAVRPVSGLPVLSRKAAVAPGPVDLAADPVDAEDRVTPRSPNLRRVLFAVDAVAATAGWGLGFLLPLLLARPVAEAGFWLGVGALGVGATLAVMASQRLYRARSCAVWSREIQRIGRAAAVTVGGAAVLAFLLDVPEAILPLAVTFVALLLSLVVGRAGYRTWLSGRRRAGQHTRDLILLGANEDAVEFQRVIHEQSEQGFRIAGLVSERSQASWARELGVPWLGPVEHAVAAARGIDATGAIAITSALEPDQLNSLARDLPRAGLHLHVAHGLRGIAYHRLHTVPLGYEPLLYVEPVGLRRRGSVQLKRVMDVALGAVSLLVATPVLLGAMLAVKLEDGGPVLFRQTRVGLGGKHFQVLKLRTMEVEAEAQRANLTAGNCRDDGPLFKLADDPRVTRVGRLLRATSLDELPQLVNVLGGQMSLVGPRPALVEEHEAFDPMLRQRNDVLPGITGLWQVEARDNPAFGAYRRLDLYYVENWSLGLDLAILAATAVSVTGRAVLVFRRLLPRRRRAAPGQSAVSSETLPAVLE